MSIFDNIVFDEFTLLEGKQAEEYKKRKAEEKEKAEKEYISKAENRRKRVEDSISNNKRGNRNIISDDEHDKLVSKTIDSFSSKHLETFGKRYTEGDKTVNADLDNASNSALRHYTKEFKKNKREGH